MHVLRNTTASRRAVTQYRNAYVIPAEMSICGGNKRRGNSGLPAAPHKIADDLIGP
jgi:hypothetical protein